MGESSRCGRRQSAAFHSGSPKCALATLGGGGLAPGGPCALARAVGWRQPKACGPPVAALWGPHGANSRSHNGYGHAIRCCHRWGGCAANEGFGVVGGLCAAPIVALTIGLAAAVTAHIALRHRPLMAPRRRRARRRRMRWVRGRTTACPPPRKRTASRIAISAFARSSYFLNCRSRLRPDAPLPTPKTVGKERFRVHNRCRGD